MATFKFNKNGKSILRFVKKGTPLEKGKKRIKGILRRKIAPRKTRGSRYV